MTSALVEPVLIEIKVWMARRRLNQSELAAKIGEGQPWLSKRLNGTVGLGVDDLVRIAAALEVPPGTFLQSPDPKRSATELMQYRYPVGQSGKSRAKAARTPKAAA